MFIESSSPLISESPFMGERRLVALLKELLSLNRASLFYKHFTATRFSRQTPFAGERLSAIRSLPFALASLPLMVQRTSHSSSTSVQNVRVNHRRSHITVA